MSEALPDRLCANPKSPFYNAELLEKGIGVRFRGIERTNVEEYCISERWVRMAVGKATDRFGQPLTMKMTGDVEVFLKPRTE
jgi:predicted house-cleaning NTP pyrophosphatase (Maf/HAM1 superfamily)